MTKHLPLKLSPPVRRPHPRTARKIYLAHSCCETCKQRWEDVRFYGLPPSALCPTCPHVADWTGNLFDGFD